VTLKIFSDSLNPENFCQQITFSLHPAVNFQLPITNRLSSGVFIDKPPNSFSVVRNDLLVFGQIVTNGIEVTWTGDPEFMNEIQICIPLESLIEPSDRFSVWELGKFFFPANS
jgi:hypothetical protein